MFGIRGLGTVVRLSHGNKNSIGSQDGSSALERRGIPTLHEQALRLLGTRNLLLEKGHLPQVQQTERPQDPWDP